MKINSQQEVHRNFDIAATRIHVERFIGRVRDWRILNQGGRLTKWIYLALFGR